MGKTLSALFFVFATSLACQSKTIEIKKISGEYEFS